MDKVYLVMVHETGENASVYAVYSTAEKAEGVVKLLNDQFVTGDFLGMWVDYISKEVQ